MDFRTLTILEWRHFCIHWLSSSKVLGRARIRQNAVFTPRGVVGVFYFVKIYLGGVIIREGKMSGETLTG